MLKLLGLAYRAKKVTVGTDITINKVRNNQIFLVILATDASDATKKKVYDKCKSYNTDVVELAASKEISEALGKRDIKVMGITDKGFSQSLVERGRK